MQPLNYIDIFAGAGGISLGLSQAGWTGLFAIEKNEMAFDTLNFNLIKNKTHYIWPNWLEIKSHDINEILIKNVNELKSYKNKVDLVTGGPPCQGFSMAGKRRYNDERNMLVHSYLKFIEIIQPKYLLLENVSGFASKFGKDENADKAYSEFVKEKLEKINYLVEHRIIDFSEYGIPQKRRRFILMGSKKRDPNDIFNKINKNKKQFLLKKGLQTYTSTKEAISDLERIHGESVSSKFKRFKEGKYGIINSSYQKYMRKLKIGKNPDSHRFANHRNTTIERWKYILDNCQRNTTIEDKVKIKFNLKKQCIIPLAANMASPTLTTLPDDFIHYSEPRILTVREYARLQSFPDWYEFKGKYTTGGLRRREEVPRYSQIGNAVPPLFIELCGTIVKEEIKSE